MKRFSIGSAVTAGVLGTLAMTALMYAAPLLGLPKMDLIGALGQALPIGLPTHLTGSLIHLGNGIVLAIIYALAFATRLPGPRHLKGALYSILPWIFALVALAPAMALLQSVLPAAAAGPPLNPCGAVAANPCGAVATVNPCAAVAAANPCAAVAAANPCAAAAAGGGAAPSATLLAMMSLMAHLVYGLVIGAAYHGKDRVSGAERAESKHEMEA